MALSGYDYGPDSFAQLLIAKFYPERTDKESAIIRDYLKAHLIEFDRVSFSVRVGKGATPDPDHLPAIQRATVYSSQKRIDVVAWQGNQVFLIEAKSIVGYAVMGQLLLDRHLWLEDYPDSPEPSLVAIGRTSDPDSLRGLSSHGVDVFLYDAPVTE